MKRREEVDKYRDMADEDLHAEVDRLKESLFRLNFKLALGEVDAIKKMRQEKNRWRVFGLRFASAKCRRPGLNRFLARTPPECRVREHAGGVRTTSKHNV